MTTMKDGYSFNTYYYWNGVFPLVLGLCLACFPPIIIGITHLVLTRTKCLHWCVDYFIDLVFPYLKVTIRGSLEKKKEPHRLILHGHNIPMYNLAALSAITSLVIGSTFVSFWASFLTDEIFTCDPQLDCFLVSMDPLLHPVSEKLLENCTYDDGNARVVCFLFVFNVREGLSSAVGFLAAAVVCFNAYLYILFWLIDLDQHPCNEKEWVNRCKFMCSRCGIALLIILPLVIYTVILIITFEVSFVTDVMSQNKTGFFVYITCTTCFLAAGPVACAYILFSLWCSSVKECSISTSSLV